MKGILALLLLGADAHVALAADAQEPANPNANDEPNAILKYFEGLPRRPSKIRPANICSPASLPTTAIGPASR